MESSKLIEDCLSQFSPISLSEMESVKLMNRIDTKYAVPLSVLPSILEMAKEEYYAQEIDGKRIATYDTMYYDTEDMDMYLRHHDRQLVRQKIRARTTRAVPKRNVSWCQASTSAPRQRAS